MFNNELFINEELDVRDLEIAQLVELGPFFPLRPNIRILVVVDGSVGTTDAAQGFAIGKVVELLRSTNVGCTSFTVDMAIRDSQNFSDNPTTTPGQARYRGFRFNSTAAGGQPVINGYHELFLFGFHPGNSGSGDDGLITSPAALPTTDAELLVLDTFMRDRKGGVFGTGDHHFLGASMTHRIPRLSTMRRWSNADGVPTIGGTTRLDTHQPATPAQESGAALIPGSAQRDDVAQPIEWVADRSFRSGFTRFSHPHAVLCHPTHGPINVMPDHAHEGRVREPHEIDLDASYDFGAGQHDEYPFVGGSRLEPKVIAYGRTVPDPPHNHAKGAQPAVRFPMISVYDGHRASIGRVVTDSTWHHWMNLNITGIENAADQTDWEKIARYFINVATWLAPPGVFRSRCWWEVAVASFSEIGIEEFRPRATTLELGEAFRAHLYRIYGPCWVRQFIIDILKELHPKVLDLVMRDIDPKFPDVCLSCPPWEILEAEILGGIIKGTRTPVERFAKAFEAGDLRDRRRRFDLTTEELRDAAMKGADRALASLSKSVVRDSKAVINAFEG